MVVYALRGMIWSRIYKYLMNKEILNIRKLDILLQSAKMGSIILLANLLKR